MLLFVRPKSAPPPSPSASASSASADPIAYSQFAIRNRVGQKGTAQPRGGRMRTTDIQFINRSRFGLDSWVNRRCTWPTTRLRDGWVLWVARWHWIAFRRHLGGRACECGLHARLSDDGQACETRGRIELSCLSSHFWAYSSCASTATDGRRIMSMSGQ